MQLKDYRKQIDDIDSELIKLFKRRMEVSSKVAQLKKLEQTPIFDPGREREVISRVTDMVPAELQPYAGILYATLFDLSRSYQTRFINGDDRLGAFIEKAIAGTPESFPAKASVACQGIEGAYSQQAVDRMFSMPDILYFQRFEGVFQAVEQGLCRYGVLPIENSLYGSVNEVYDLMKRYSFFIVKSLKFHVRHSLLANKGAGIKDITEVCSHEQGIGQCGRFLKTLGDVRTRVCENTAVAARMVAQSGRNDWAALSSRGCASLYGLSILADDVQDNNSNYTRFICISKEPEIYAGANKISLMLSVAHRPGALYRIISQIASRGVNLAKLESRPIPGSDFEFMFYFDLEASVKDRETILLLREIEKASEQFAFLGNFCEV
jgi:chorismate mutase/prephenate dehydratase